MKVKQGHFSVGVDKAYSLTGKVSEKHAFLDITQGHRLKWVTCQQPEAHALCLKHGLDAASDI